MEREFEGRRIACLIGLLVGINDCDEVTEDHPVMSAVVQPLLDPADPLNFTHRFLAERSADGPAPSIVMTEGTADQSTPPRAIEALAAGIGLPIVEPVVRTWAPYELMDTPTVSAPVQDNITLADGAMVTGGLVQWDGAGHFVIFRRSDARGVYSTFFRSAADGSPRIAAR
jgi:hypothetical protein